MALRPVYYIEIQNSVHIYFTQLLLFVNFYSSNFVSHYRKNF
jgi:hypothetical protein